MNLHNQNFLGFPSVGPQDSEHKHVYEVTRVQEAWASIRLASHYPPVAIHHVTTEEHDLLDEWHLLNRLELAGSG